MKKIRGKSLKEWKEYCKGDNVPLKTMKYIIVLEERLEAINYTRCCESDSEQLKCNHTWIVNHHQGSRYCSKGCDNFEKHKF
tara:strand:- start:382 stop:627 length:246 start_codon:yes stop_codon:yes gene_type:complete